MLTFFYGWRRKLGVVTLVMALSALGGWVRSFSVTDDVMFPARKHMSKSTISVAVDILMIAKGYIVWARAHEECTDLEANEALAVASAYPTWDVSPEVSRRDFESLELNWRWCGFGFGESEHIEEAWQTTLFIPYWSIVIPLTLVSACLILTKPRVAKTAAVTEN